MALIADRCTVEAFMSVEHYDFSHPMDYFDGVSHCGEDNEDDNEEESEEDGVFIDDGHVWFSLYLDEIVCSHCLGHTLLVIS